MVAKVILCLAIGYCFGLFQTGYIYGKLHGVDIRQYGSHSSGATNTLRTFGKGAGYIAFAGDVIKTVAAMHLVRFILFRGSPEADALGMVAGIGVILGHDFPFYLHFKGGKGVSSTGGVMLGIYPLIALIEGILFIGMFYAVRIVSVVSLTVVTLFPFMILIFFHGNMTLFGISWIIVAIDWFQHRENIRRLINGTENKFERKKKD